MDTRDFSSVAIQYIAEYPIVKFDGSENKIEYFPQYSMFGLNTRSGEKAFFKMSKDFLNYLHTSTLKYFVEAKEMKKFYNENDFSFLCLYLNDAKVKQNNSGKKKSGKRVEYKLIIINNVAYALAANYNPVHHYHVLNQIQEHKLDHRITHIDMSEQTMRVYIRSSHCDENGKWLFGVSVINGMTGITPFSFKSFVKIGNNFYNVTNFRYEEEKRKHLSLTNMVFDKIQSELDKDFELELITTLTRFSSTFAIQLLEYDDFSEIMTSLVHSTANGSAFSVILELDSYKDKHGMKGKVQKAIQLILDKVNETWELERTIY